MQRVIRSRSDYRQTILRNQLTSLILYETLRTTKAKAKLLISFANRFYNKIKTADLTAKKLAHATILDKMAIRKLFEEILPRYQKTETTFVNVLRLTSRPGDNAPMALVSLIHQLKVESKTKPQDTKTIPDESLSKQATQSSLKDTAESVTKNK